MCNENRDLTVLNTNFKNFEKELVLIREKLGKRPIGLNKTNIDDIINENLALRIVLSHSNTNEKSIDMLIKSYRKSHDKKGVGFDQIIHHLVLSLYILSYIWVHANLVISRESI